MNNKGRLVKFAVCPNCGFREELEAEEHLENFYPKAIDKVQFHIGRRKSKPIDIHGNILCCKQCHRIAVIEIRVRKKEG